MSREIDDLDLIIIQQLAKRSQKVQELIQEKNNTLIDLERRATTRFKKLDPAPSPTNDKRIFKNHTKQILTPDELQREQQRISKEFNHDIKQAMIEKAIETKQEEYVPILENIESENLAVLNEKGIEAFKDQQPRISHDKANNIPRFDLDEVGRFNHLLTSYQFKDNTKDFDRTKQPDPADDFE